MRHDEVRKDVNYRLWTCNSCHELWLMPEDMRSPWHPNTCTVRGEEVRDLCIVHRLRRGSIGFFDKCGGCLYRFLCASSVPKVWS